MKLADFSVCLSILLRGGEGINVWFTNLLPSVRQRS